MIWLHEFSRSIFLKHWERLVNIIIRQFPNIFGDSILTLVSFSISLTHATQSMLEEIGSEGYEMKSRIVLVNTRNSLWEMFFKKGVLFCVVTVLWILVDLLWTRRLLPQGSAFFPGHFTRDTNRFIIQGGQVFLCKKGIQNSCTSQDI